MQSHVTVATWSQDHYLQTRQGHDARGFYLKATSAYKMMTHWLAFLSCLVRFRLAVQPSASDDFSGFKVTLPVDRLVAFIRERAQVDVDPRREEAFYQPLTR